MSYSIVTYCSSNYRDILKFSLPSWLRSDCKYVHIYSDDNFEPELPTVGPKCTVHPVYSSSCDFGLNCARKANALYLHMRNQPNDDQLVLLDVDCLLLGYIGGVFGFSDFDVAPPVSLQATSLKKQLRSVSAGCLFLRNTTRTMNLVRDWVASISGRSKSRDEIALSKTLVKARKSAMIQPIPEHRYNNYPISASTESVRRWVCSLDSSVRVLHFHSGLWKNQKLVRTALRAHCNG